MPDMTFPEISDAAAERILDLLKNRLALLERFRDLLKTEIEVLLRVHQAAEVERLAASKRAMGERISQADRELRVSLKTMRLPGCRGAGDALAACCALFPDIDAGEARNRQLARECGEMNRQVGIILDVYRRHVDGALHDLQRAREADSVYGADGKLKISSGAA